MFSSSSNNNGYNPFLFTTNQTMTSFTPNDQNPNSSPFFPMPFLDDDNEFLMMSSQFLPNQQILGSTTTCNNNLDAADAEINNNNTVSQIKKITNNKKKSTTATAANGSAKQTNTRKRTGKKDRHSKIYTAQGPRDRRMRLSLQIARKFFDLQDMLGFDKASKTIEWLFSKSKSAIKDLTESLPIVKHSCKSASSTSESEVVSGGRIINNEITDQENGQHKLKKEAMAPRRSRESSVVNKKSRKEGIFSPRPVARESRDKARARARERTMEKMKMRSGLEKSSQHFSSDNYEANPNDLEQLGSSSALELTGENCSQEMNSNSVKVVADKEEEKEAPSIVHLLENQMDSVSIIEKFLGITSTAGPIFNYSHNIGDSNGENSQDFSGNWTINNDRLLQYSYCAMKGSTGNNVQVQNPNSILMTNPNITQQHESSTSSVFIKKPNPTSVFMNPSNTHHKNPSSSLMSNSSSVGLQSHFLEHQFSCNPPHPANQNRSLY